MCGVCVFTLDRNYRESSGLGATTKLKTLIRTFFKQIIITAFKSITALFYIVLGLGDCVRLLRVIFVDIVRQ